MKIKEVCERTGLTRRAVRFYEEKGLISPEIREENEYRDYTETDVRRLQLVARLRGYRFSVEEIRRLLERPQETEAVFAAHRQELADEQEEGAAILESLERLRLPDSGAPESLYESAVPGGRRGSGSAAARSGTRLWTFRRADKGREGRAFPPGGGKRRAH